MQRVYTANNIKGCQHAEYIHLLKELFVDIRLRLVLYPCGRCGNTLMCGSTPERFHTSFVLYRLCLVPPQ